MTAPTRTQLELLQDQLRGMAAWHAANRVAAERAQAASREMRMDVNRRMQALRRANKELQARAAALVAESEAALTTARAVVVHRNEWAASTIVSRLEERGVRVLARMDDGADGLGALIAEQPELLVVEESLPSIPGAELVRWARRVAPLTAVAVQVAYGDDVARMVEAGASAVFTRQVPPVELADELADLLLA